MLFDIVPILHVPNCPLYMKLSYLYEPPPKDVTVATVARQVITANLGLYRARPHDLAFGFGDDCREIALDHAVLFEGVLQLPLSARATKSSCAACCLRSQQPTGAPLPPKEMKRPIDGGVPPT